MFVNDRLVFVELHKTGCTHIGKWLGRLIGGEQIGKHNRVPRELHSRFVIGSVRNPWDWYVSLWAYGCSARGAVYHRVTRNLDLHYLRTQLGPEMGEARPTLSTLRRQVIADIRKPTSTWCRLYSDARDVNAFRHWLGMMMNPMRRFDMAEGFGFSPLSSWAGLMSYRYLRLFTTLQEELYEGKALATPERAMESWQRSKLTSFIIRNEHLENDLLEGLSRAGFQVSPQHRDAFVTARERKTNTSERMAAWAYYDDVTMELVAQREALIIREHGYRPPVTSSRFSTSL